MNLLDFAAKLATIERDLNTAAEVTVMKGAHIIKERAKDAIGHQDNGFNWPPLKPATIAQKRYGNTPLYETGDLKHSIEVAGPFHEGARTVSAVVGTNDPKAAFHEYGTSKIPARPFMLPAAIDSEAAIVKLAEKQVAKAFAGGAAYHELRELLHALHRVYEAGREVVEGLDGDD